MSISSALQIEHRAKALNGLLRLARKPDLRLVACHPGGRFEMRFHGRDGSNVDFVMRVPPIGAAARKLFVENISGWHAPTGTQIGEPDDPLFDAKTAFMLLMIVNICKETVLDVLGAAARSAEWWTDVDQSQTFR